MKLDLLEELLGKGLRATVRVRGGSMWPALRDGDVVTLAPPALLRRGDLAAARAGDQLIIHRVLRTQGDRVLLRGDTLPSDDGLFVPLARVESFRRAGRTRAPHRSVLAARLGRLLARLRRR